MERWRLDKIVAERSVAEAEEPTIADESSRKRRAAKGRFNKWLARENAINERVRGFMETVGLDEGSTEVILLSEADENSRGITHYGARVKQVARIEDEGTEPTPTQSIIIFVGIGEGVEEELTRVDTFDLEAGKAKLRPKSLAELQALEAEGHSGKLAKFEEELKSLEKLVAAPSVA